MRNDSALGEGTELCTHSEVEKWGKMYIGFGEGKCTFNIGVLTLETKSGDRASNHPGDSGRALTPQATIICLFITSWVELNYVRACNKVTLEKKKLRGGAGVRVESRGR